MRQIPEHKIIDHLMHDQDFPTLPDDKPKYEVVRDQTFTTTGRFFDEES